MSKQRRTVLSGVVTAMRVREEPQPPKGAEGPSQAHDRASTRRGVRACSTDLASGDPSLGILSAVRGLMCNVASGRIPRLRWSPREGPESGR
jgi:hypothetical protein